MKLLRRLMKSRLVRNASNLMIGTVLAQIVGFAALPFLTRLYEPAHFGLMAVFITISGVLGKLLTMRYDNALVIPAVDSDAWALLRTVTLWIVLGSVAATVVFFPWRDELLGLFEAEGLVSLYLFFPLVIVGQGCLGLLTYWATRKDHFAAQSVSSVTGACAGNGLKLALGTGGFGTVGLLAGTALQHWSQLAVIWYRIRATRPERTPGVGEGLRQAVRYSSFPKYRMPQDVVNYIGTQLPNLILAAFFSPQIVGFYLLAHRLLQLPLSVVREAVRRALYRRFSEDHHADRSPLRVCTEITIFMALLVVPPSLVVMAFGTELMNWVLGPEWAPAGPYLSWMMVAVGSAFFNVPVVVLITLMEWNRFFLMFETVSTAVRSAVLVVSALFWSPVTVVAAFSLATAAANVVLVVGVLVVLRKRFYATEQIEPEEGKLEYSLQ